MKLPTFRVRLWALMVAVGVVAVVTAWARRQNLAELDRVARESARLDDRLWGRRSKRMFLRAKLHADLAELSRKADEETREHEREYARQLEEHERERARLQKAMAKTRRALGYAAEPDDSARAKRNRAETDRIRERFKSSRQHYEAMAEYHSRLKVKYERAARTPQVPVEPDPPPPK